VQKKPHVFVCESGYALSCRRGLKYAKGSELTKHSPCRSHKSYCSSEVYLVFGILMLHSSNIKATNPQGCSY